MNKEQRFEVFYNDELGKWVIKDNEQMPHLLDNYKSCVRLNEFAEKVDKLQSQLAEKDQAIESLQEINQSLGQTCNNDAKEIERLREQLEEVEKLRAIVKGKVLIVEDGSVDIDKLEEDGFYVIVYRNGSTPPQYLKN